MQDNLKVRFLGFRRVINVYVLHHHVWHRGFPHIHRPVEREAERFSVQHNLAEDRQFHVRHLRLIERAQIEEHLIPHALGFALRQCQTLGIIEELLVIDKRLAATYSLLQLRPEHIAGHHVGHRVCGVAAAAFDGV